MDTPSAIPKRICDKSREDATPESASLAETNTQEMFRRKRNKSLKKLGPKGSWELPKTHLGVHTAVTLVEANVAL